MNALLCAMVPFHAVDWGEHSVFSFHDSERRIFALSANGEYRVPANDH